MSPDRNFRYPSSRKKQLASGTRFVAITLLAGFLVVMLTTTSFAQGTVTPTAPANQLTPKMFVADSIDTLTPELENDIKQAMISYQNGDLSSVWKPSFQLGRSDPNQGVSRIPRKSRPAGDRAFPDR